MEPLDVQSATDFREARPGEAALLTEIAIASKAHWGYDDKFMARAAAVLVVDQSYIEQHEVWVMEQDGHVAGFYALIHHGEVSELDHLWLLPRHIGQGFGRSLFEHALRRASMRGAKRIEWEAEPNATGFYERMGARPLREATSSIGRALTIMGRDL